MNYKIILLACVCVFSASTPASSSDEKDFDTDSVSVKMSALGEDESEDSLVSLTSVPQKKKSYFSSISDYLPSTQASFLVGGAVAYTGYQYYMAPQDGVIAAISTFGSQLFSVVGGSFMAAQLFADPIKKYGYGKWMQYAPSGFLTTYSQQLQTIIRRVEAKKASWPPALVEASDIIYKECIENGGDNIKRLDCLSRLPTSVKKFNYEVVRAKAMEELVTYSDEIRTAVLDFLEDLCILSESQLPLKRKSIFFLGEAGTGKTKMAHLLKRILDVHMHIVNLSTNKELGIQEYSKSDIILDAFTPHNCENNYWNNVLLFDEIDKALCPSNDRETYEVDRLKSLFLQLLDDENLTHESKYLYHTGVNFDFSNAIIIFCGNKIPRDNSFLTRSPTVQFEKIEPMLKIVIAKNRFLKHLSKLMHETQVTDEDMAVLAKIVEIDEKFAGVRALLKVAENYSFYRVKVAKSGNGRKLPPFDVQDQYKAFLTVDELDNKAKEADQAATDDPAPAAAVKVVKASRKKFNWFKKKER
jgi:hypothetical protein